MVLILLAYGTLLFNGVLHALVFVFAEYRYARTACDAVEEVLFTALSAHTALVAMVLLL